MGAVPFEREDRVDHVLDDAGTGDLAILGDMPDDQERRSARLGEADQRLSRASDLAYRARRGFDRIAPHGLNRIDDHEFRRVSGAQSRNDILDERLGRKLHRGMRKPQPGGAEPHLGCQLLAGDIDDTPARQRRRGARLDQEGGLADARFAADQRRRSGHEAAARDPVQLGDPRDDPRLGLRLARKILEREGPASRAAPRCRAADAESRGFLDDRVPFPAGFALALPALRDGAAVLADIGRPNSWPWSRSGSFVGACRGI